MTQNQLEFKHRVILMQTDCADWLFIGQCRTNFHFRILVVVTSADSDDSLTESDGEGYDSDIQRELDIDYTTKIYSKPLRETEGVKPQHQENTETHQK